jgi:type II secretory pathway pseudopilin PulG
MKSTTKEAVRSALFEATFVVLGVILALAANEWRQARADRAQSQQAIAAIVQELNANRALVASAYDYHRNILQEIRNSEDNAPPPGFELFSRGFVAPARTSRTAWASASETGALAKTDYATVMELSKAYALQGYYETQARSVSEIIYAEIFKNGIQSVLSNYANLANTISTLLYRENELMEAYDSTIAALNSTVAASDK